MSGKQWRADFDLVAKLSRTRPIGGSGSTQPPKPSAATIIAEAIRRHPESDPAPGLRTQPPFRLERR